MTILAVVCVWALLVVAMLYVLRRYGHHDD